MKNILLALLLTTAVMAADVTLVWDASLDPGVTNYTVHASRDQAIATNLTVATAKNQTTGTNTTFASLQGGKWFFVATCTAGGVESLPSNMAAWTNRPAAVGGLRIAP